MSKPVIVAIPGAWHTPASFSGIKKKLEKDHGYTFLTRKMPSVGSNPPPKDLTQDVEALRDLVMQAIGNGNDVVVVPHSWSGIVAGNALSGLGKMQREEQGEKGGVVKIAFMCSFLAPIGVSLIDALDQTIPDWWDIKGSIVYCKDVSEVFYNDLDKADQQNYMSLLESHSFGTQNTKASANTWLDIPSSYLLCEDDNAIPGFAQEAMVEQARKMGAQFEVQRIRASHSPFLSMPDETVDFIRRAAGEKV